MFAPRRLAPPAGLFAALFAAALSLAALATLVRAALDLTALDLAARGRVAGGRVARGEAGGVAPPPEAFEARGREAFLAGPFEAEVLRVVDGDSFVARLQVWFGQQAVVTVRLRGIDAPEMAARCDVEARGAAAARRALAEMLAGGRVRLTRLARDKYFGRIVAEVTVVSPEAAFPDTEVGPALLAAGLARPYDGRARAGWCGRLATPSPRRIADLTRIDAASRRGD